MYIASILWYSYCLSVNKYTLFIIENPRVGPGCVLCPRIDPLRFLPGCRMRRLNQGLVVALGFLSLLERACFCVIFRFMGACFDCLGRFVPEMTYSVSGGTLNLAQLNSTHYWKNRLNLSDFSSVWHHSYLIRSDNIKQSFMDITKMDCCDCLSNMLYEQKGVFVPISLTI